MGPVTTSMVNSHQYLVHTGTFFLLEAVVERSYLHMHVVLNSTRAVMTETAKSGCIGGKSLSSNFSQLSEHNLRIRCLSTDVGLEP